MFTPTSGRLGLLFAAGTLAACASPSDDLPADLSVKLTSRASCGDIAAHAGNDDDTVGLVIRTPALISEARGSADSRLVVSYELPAEGVTVSLELGQRLTRNACNDAIVPGTEPDVEAAYEPVSGVLEVDVTALPEPDPRAWNNPGRATVHLRDAVFDVAGRRVTIDALDLSDLAVGWLPG